jgi:hypothetical protein
MFHPNKERTELLYIRRNYRLLETERRPRSLCFRVAQWGVVRYGASRAVLLVINFPLLEKIRVVVGAVFDELREEICAGGAI